MINVKSIRQKNLSVKYPPPVTSEVRDDPGKYGGIDDKYKYPDWDCLKEGYSLPGMNMTDFAIIRHEGLYHLYGTVGAPGTYPLWEGQHHYITHATTPDLVHWTNHRPVLFNDPDKLWEESHLWPPFVLKVGEEFYMLYVGLDRDCCQCICLATSKDLFNWKKCENNPVLDAREFSWIRKHPNGRVRHCRDPHILPYNGGHLLYYTTLCTDGYSAVGLAVSEDLKSWEDLGSCMKRDAGSWLLESTLVCEKDSKYYLFASATPGITCFESDNPFDFHHKKQVEIIGNKDLKPEDITAPEAVERRDDKGEWLVAYHNGGRIFLAIFAWSEDRIHLRRVREKEQLEHFLS